MKFHGSLNHIKLFKNFTFINFHILALINENNYIILRILLLQFVIYLADKQKELFNNCLSRYK